MPTDQEVETNIPPRLDRLPWSPWHTKMVAALGITWLLDGLGVTLAGSLASVLKNKNALGLTDVEVGGSSTGYLAGAVIGALFFGWLTDRLGRKKLFLITLALYLTATAATAFARNFQSWFWSSSSKSRASASLFTSCLSHLAKGEWQVETMQKMRLQDDDVMAMARDQGLNTLVEIEYAMLERSSPLA